MANGQHAFSDSPFREDLPALGVLFGGLATGAVVSWLGSLFPAYIGLYLTLVGALVVAVITACLWMISKNYGSAKVVLFMLWLMISAMASLCGAALWYPF